MMSYTRNELQKIIEKSVAILQKEHAFLLRIDNDINERTVTSQLRAILENFFREYDIDAEYNRMFKENNYVTKKLNLLIEDVKSDETKAKTVYPDIIVHRRGTDKNLLVIEVKMKWKNDERQKDFDKLKAYTRELQYSFGVYLEIGEEGITDMKWFQRGEALE